MNRWIPYAGIPVSVALAYGLVFLVPYAFAAIAAAIPLLYLSRRAAGIAGFLAGLLEPFSIYLLYPLQAVSRLSGILSQLTGFPPVLLIVIYPLMYGIIEAVSALLFVGVRERAAGSGRKEPAEA